MDKNIVLIGMMGCGKSTAGELLARRLGRPLADTDAVIEQRQGRAIPEIFARDGEAGFRALELELCRELSGQGGLVIACGGGLPTREGAIAALKDARVTPETTCAWSVAHGYKALKQGTYYSYFKPQLAAFGVQFFQRLR